MRNVIIVLFVIFILFIALPVLALGYLGFVPSVSAIMGTNKPRDLGVSYTQEDARVAYEKNSVEAISLPQTDNISESVRYEGQKDVTFSMTDSEITALINGNTWQYQPVSSVQIRINPDGTGEASGLLHVDRILPYIALTHSTEEVRDAMNKYHIGGTPAFYLKGRVIVENNVVSLSSDKVEIGRVTVPSSLVVPNLPALEDFVEDRINVVPNLMVASLTLEDGLVNFRGTMPAIEYKSM